MPLVATWRSGFDAGFDDPGFEDLGFDDQGFGPGGCWALLGATGRRWAPQVAAGRRWALLGNAGHICANFATCSWEPLTMLNPHFVAGEHGLFGGHKSEDIQTFLKSAYLYYVDFVSPAYIYIDKIYSDLDSCSLFK